MNPRRAMPLRRRLLLAAAGGIGAAIWAAQQPLDKRVFRSGYDDVELLGKLVNTDRWRTVGLAAHVVNGAAFGLAYSEVLRRTPSVSPMVSAQVMAQVENVGLYPLAAIVDSFHPARDELAPAFGVRQLGQATWRHALFGVVLGVAGERVCSREP
ncbi:MAG: hypothetical protein JWL76_630 [Thermoleophilia bacterium]|nr:hypothetical protein [Thermoleophilia bacterium]